MRFYAKFVFICNICFIISAFLRLVELNRKSAGNFTGAIGYQPIESALVVLGYGAIIFNLIFFLLAVVQFLRKQLIAVPRWIVLFNLVMLIVQVYYFFFTNI